MIVAAEPTTKIKYDPAEPNPGVIDPAHPYQDYGHFAVARLLIYGDQRPENVSITGPSGNDLRQRPRPQQQRQERSRQQVDRAQALQERPPPRFHHQPRRMVRHPRHRRGQHDHRQSQDRHQSRRHGHRLLPKRTASSNCTSRTRPATTESAPRVPTRSANPARAKTSLSSAAR